MLDTRTLWCGLLLLTVILPVRAESADEYPSIGKIERADPRFDELIAPGAKLEVLADGFEWSEGPVWVADGGHLLFSDIPNNCVMKWKQGQGAEVFLKPSGYTGETSRGGQSGSNGLLLDSSGRLLLCQHGDRQVARLERDGEWTVLADRYRGRRLNSPNDAVFKSNGDLYFTDPPYGLSAEDRATIGELGFCGVYRLGTDARLTLLYDQMTRPNGIAFSPDEKTLYVAQSDPQAALWRAFDVNDDGTISNGRVFFDITDQVGKRKGLPDGMTVDRHGNLFATGPGGVNVFAPDGSLLGRVDTGEATANCTFGEDGTVLYITADMYLCRIQTKTKGLGFE